MFFLSLPVLQSSPSPLSLSGLLRLFLRPLLKRRPPSSLTAFKCTPNNDSRLAWASFWTQLSLSIVSAVVLFFTAAQSRPTWAAQGGALPLPFPFLCTAAGVAGSLVSTALAFGLTRITRAVIVRGESVKRSAVVAGALAATRLNLWSTGAALVGLQATVGSLVSSTLLTATQNPFAVAQNAGARAAAPVALDVFAVQASANVLVSHFASIVFATWLIRLLARAPPSKGPPQRRRRDADDYEFSLPGEAAAAAPAKTAFEAAQDFKKGAY